MGSILAEITVPDYAKWRTNFDTNAPARTAAGLSNARVFRNADNANHILVIGDSADPGKARQTLLSPEYRARMEAGGTTSPPKIYIIE